MTDIKGYKVLTDEQIHCINVIKQNEAQCLGVLKGLSVSSFDADKRWLAIARTNLEQGFMAAVRAITRPDTIEF